MNESAEMSAAAANVRIIPSIRDIDESWGAAAGACAPN